MKKHLSLILMALTMLLLLFVPEPAWADYQVYDDVSTYIVQPYTIEKVSTTGTVYVEFYKNENSNVSGTVSINLDYRIATDGGDYGSWNNIATAGITTANDLYGASLTLSDGHIYKVQFRGVNEGGFSKLSSDYYHIIMKVADQNNANNSDVRIYGNIMSLIKGFDTDNLATAQATLQSADEIPSDYCFYYFSRYDTNGNYIPKVDASNLILPATKLKDYCYQGLFSSYCHSDTQGGLIYGPTILATDFVKANSTATTGVCNQLCISCTNLKGIRVNFNCPANTNNLTYWLFMDNDIETLYAPSSFLNCANNGGGSTLTVSSKESWSYDPSAEPGGDEPGGSNVFAPASVDVYQAATTDRTEILYDLPANAVDLGTGVAWATTDYDASTLSKFAADTRGATGLTGSITGSYCYCDPRTQITQNVWYQYSSITPPANWRFPTDDECFDLTQNTYSLENYENGNRFQINSRISDEDYIQLSCVGFLLYGSGGGGYYNTSWQDINHYYIRINSTECFGYGNDGKPTVIADMNGESYMMPARFVYDPSFTTHTLTVKAGDHYYHYICKEGQEVTVTAHANTAENCVFKWWSDDHSNTTAERTFIVNSDIEVEAVFIDPSIPHGSAIFVDWNGAQLYETVVLAGDMPVYGGATPARIGYTFTGWSPALAVMGNSDVTYTATYAFESADVNVNAYQATTTDVHKIVYNLSAKTGDDGLTYTPVDMGYGVAWADRNVGANQPTNVGKYFYWGDTEGHTSFSNSQYYADNSLSNGYTLTAEHDAATVNIGAAWRMPTADEWAKFKNTTILGADNGTFTNPTDNTQSIFLPATGIYGGTSSKQIDWDYYVYYLYITTPALRGTAYRYYWSSVLYKTIHPDTDETLLIPWALSNDNSNEYIVSSYSYNANSSASTKKDYNMHYYGMPVRAIYNPQYTVRTLTVRVGNHDYIYYCQDGQQVTVTAVPDASNAQMFKWWSDDNSNTTATRTFTMTNDDISVEAVFQIDPSIPTHTATFVNYNGTQLDQVTVPEGVTPVYGGVAPTKTDCYFNGWSPAIAPMGTTDITYTATYRSIESADKTVNVYQNASNNITKILYNLDPKRGETDNKEYIPVDMGYGVAWADRNIGADEPEDHGGWYQWGGIEDKTSSITNDKTPDKSGGKSESGLVTGDTLTNLEDAAYRVMGSCWQMPSKAEWESFLASTTESSSTFYNKTDNTQRIYLPEGGYIYLSGHDLTAKRVYWTKTYYNGGSSNRQGPYILHNNTSYRVNYIDNQRSTGYYLSAYMYAPVRAIYKPKYNIKTLTINSNGYSHVYKCQEGQSITVTANATTEGHVFDKWTEDNDTHATRTFVMTENITRTATFKEAPLVTTYDVTIESSNTSYGTVDVAAIDDVESGTEISVSGSTLTIGSTTVTAKKHADDAQYTYAFTGWTDDTGKDLPESVTDDLAIRANFTQSKKQYTLTWNFDGGTTATADGDYTHGSVEWGTTIKAPANPTKGGYDFAGWDATPASTMPAATTTYTAKWTAQSNDFDLYDDKNTGDDFYTALEALIGKERNVRYIRTLAAKQWCVFSLPFSLNLRDSSNPFYDCVYTFDGATYEADGTLSFNFIANTVGTEANKPYIYYSSTGVTNPVFNGVTIVASEESAANSVKLDNSEVNTVSFVNTVVRTKLTNLLTENKRLIYINNNTLYYPKDDSNVWMRAFRGYFKLNNVDIRYVNPRVRIVMDGQTVTEIETAGAMEDASVRKYVQDGMLLIERNGVVYNAQGAVVR